MDPLSLSALAGAAVAPVFTFLFGRLASLLDNRASRTGKNAPAQETEQIETPAVVHGVLKPLQVNDEQLQQRLGELEVLAGSLGVYDRNPDRLQVEDVKLLENMGRLRDHLECIYGQRITFVGEQRPTSGSRVDQSIDVVEGDMTGIEGKNVRSAHITQKARHVPAGGKVIGIKADDVR
ncbi:hypothetical protein JOF53_006603 [Crossiella equi]|uniref:Uncharacterized protein n=1 Tax=Crossiella equi TaxID=130796 RepID=A0ABS5AME7_9PSEU|nr:hypothetical protein [Crossiella equi]MBP2477731.1 hypothetical protein [Crossiella equi]